jgi:hypothetical protein
VQRLTNSAKQRPPSPPHTQVCKTKESAPVYNQARMAILQRSQHVSEVARGFSLGERIVLLDALHQLAAITSIHNHVYKCFVTHRVDQPNLQKPTQHLSCPGTKRFKKNPFTFKYRRKRIQQTPSIQYGMLKSNDTHLIHYITCACACAESKKTVK